MFDLLEARPIYDVLGHKSGVTAVKFSSKGDFFASGSEDKAVYIWKTNFDEVDDQLGLNQANSKPSKVRKNLEIRQRKTDYFCLKLYVKNNENVI